jgi:hypothetical protein
MIDPATLEKIAYRLKHAAGVYVDLKWTDLGSPASTECLEYADLLLDYARSSFDDVSPSPDNHPADNQRELPDAAAALIFNRETPEGERRLRLALDAENTRLALSEYDNKLRAFVKYGVENTIYAEQEPEEVIRMVRELFHSYLSDYGIDLTED